MCTKWAEIFISEWKTSPHIVKKNYFPFDQFVIVFAAYLQKVQFLTFFIYFSALSLDKAWCIRCNECMYEYLELLGKVFAKIMQQHPFCSLIIVKDNATTQNVEKLKFSMEPKFYLKFVCDRVISLCRLLRRHLWLNLAALKILHF